jgi:tRNA pseudouridine55 synthase
VRPVKAGHAGTLDPLATGVLVVGLGSATRLVEYVQQFAKTYQATFLLGRSSDTEDVTGLVTELPNARAPSHAEITALLPRFLGTIQQRPPAYSALKVDGQRAYKMARRGDDVQLAARPIVIHSLEIVRYECPELELLVRCGSGTYIRSLGRDLAEALGDAAVMSQLRRLEIGPFRVEEGVQLGDLTLDLIHERLLPPVLAVSALPHVIVSDVETDRLVKGQPIHNSADRQRTNWPSETQPRQEIAAISERGNLVAILQFLEGNLKPIKCFGSGPSHPQLPTLPPGN